MYSSDDVGRGHAPVFLAVCCAFLAYFSYHTINGDNGVKAREVLEKRISQLNLDLSYLKEQKRILDRNVSLLRPEQIDPDMLDEEVRRLLNFARPDEIIVMDLPRR